MVRSTVTGVGSSGRVSVTDRANDKARRSWQIQDGEKLNHERRETACR